MSKRGIQSHGRKDLGTPAVVDIPGPLSWATAPRLWLDVILGVSVRLFFGAEVNIEISKAVLSLMWVQLEA